MVQVGIEPGAAGSWGRGSNHRVIPPTCLVSENCYTYMLHFSTITQTQVLWSLQPNDRWIKAHSDVSAARKTYDTPADVRPSSQFACSLSISSNCTFVQSTHGYRLAHISATTSGRSKGGAHEGCRPHPPPHSPSCCCCCCFRLSKYDSYISVYSGNAIKMQTRSHDWIITQSKNMPANVIIYRGVGSC